jgi:tRNA(Ile)-lysidine synthase TilS/MesJ
MGDQIWKKKTHGGWIFNVKKNLKNYCKQNKYQLKEWWLNLKDKKRRAEIRKKFVIL